MGWQPRFETRLGQFAALLALGLDGRRARQVVALGIADQVIAQRVAQLAKGGQL